MGEYISIIIQNVPTVSYVKFYKMIQFTMIVLGGCVQAWYRVVLSYIK